MYAGTWTHVVWAMTRPTPSATTGTSRIYINGVLRETTYKFFFPIAATSINYIGKSQASPEDDLFVGSIDALGFYPWVMGLSDVLEVLESLEIMVGTCLSVLLCMFMG